MRIPNGVLNKKVHVHELVFLGVALLFTLTANSALMNYRDHVISTIEATNERTEDLFTPQKSTESVVASASTSEPTPEPDNRVSDIPVSSKVQSANMNKPLTSPKPQSNGAQSSQTTQNQPQSNQPDPQPQQPGPEPGPQGPLGLIFCTALGLFC